MTQPTSKVGIILTGFNEDRDLIKGIIDLVNSEYSHMLEFVPSGKESLQIDISLMSAQRSNILEEVEFIVQTAIAVKKYERKRNRIIKKALGDAVRNNRKNIN